MLETVKHRLISCYYDDDGSQVRLKIPLLQKFQIISKSERDLASKNYFAIKIIHNSHFFIIHTREERLFHEFLNKRVCFGREMVVEKKEGKQYANEEAIKITFRVKLLQKHFTCAQHKRLRGK